MKKLILPVAGLAAGVINGLLGAGGGIIVLLFLKLYGLPEKECHATSVAAVLLITTISAIVYVVRGDIYIQGFDGIFAVSLLGGVVGGVFLKKISNKWLTLAFGVLLLFAGIRQVFIV